MVLTKQMTLFNKCRIPECFYSTSLLATLVLLPFHPTWTTSFFFFSCIYIYLGFFFWTSNFLFFRGEIYIPVYKILIHSFFFLYWPYISILCFEVKLNIHSRMLIYTLLKVNQAITEVGFRSNYFHFLNIIFKW